MSQFASKNKTIETIRIVTGCTGYNGILMETVMLPVGLCNLSPFISGLLKSLHSNGICPKTLQGTGFNGE